MAERKTFSFTDEFGNTESITGPASASRDQAFEMFLKKVERDGIKWGKTADVSKEGGVSLEQRGEDVFGFDPKAKRLPGFLPHPRGSMKGEKGPIDWTDWIAGKSMVDVVNRALLPGHAAQGGQYSQGDVGGFALDYAMPGAQGLTHARRNLPTRKEFVKNAPTTDQIKQEAGGIFGSVRGSGGAVGGNTYGSFLGDVGAKVMDEGLDDVLHPKSSAAFKNIQKLLFNEDGTASASVTVKQLITARRQLGVARRGHTDELADDRRLAEIMTDMLDDFVDNAFSEAGPKLAKARKLWSNAKKSEMIEEAIEAGANYKQGLEAGIRQAISNILKSPKKKRGFTKDEIKALQRVVKSDSLTKMFRMLGALDPTRGSNNLLGTMTAVAGGGGAGGYFGGGPGAVLGAIGVGGAGYLGQRAATAGTTNAAEFARALAATGGRSPALAGMQGRGVVPYGLGIAAGTQMQNGGQPQQQAPVPAEIARRRNSRGFRQ